MSDSEDDDDDSEVEKQSDTKDDKKTRGGRTLRERRAPEKKKATVVVPKKAAAASGRSSSQPRAKPATASISEPNQLTPQKTAVTISYPQSSPLNNPTPAMIELMQRINQKRALAAKGKPIANKLLTNAVTTQNKKVARKLTPTGARSSSATPSANGDLNKPVKKRPGRPPSISPKKVNSIVSNGTKRIPADRSKSPAAPDKRRPGRPPKSPVSSVSPKLSSNSSTHSTKENKYVVPTRRSPRAAKK